MSVTSNQRSFRKEESRKLNTYTGNIDKSKWDKDLVTIDSIYASLHVAYLDIETETKHQLQQIGKPYTFLLIEMMHGDVIANFQMHGLGIRTVNEVIDALLFAQVLKRNPLDSAHKHTEPSVGQGALEA